MMSFITQITLFFSASVSIVLSIGFIYRSDSEFSVDGSFEHPSIVARITELMIDLFIYNILFNIKYILYLISQVYLNIYYFIIITGDNFFKKF